MAAEVRGVARDDDEVARASRDLLVAARADVALHGLEGMDQANLDRHPISAHATSRATTAKHTATTT